MIIKSRLLFNFFIDSCSAPGPEDFRGSFYHSFWDVIADAVCFLQRFLRSQFEVAGKNVVTKFLPTALAFKMGTQLLIVLLCFTFESLISLVSESLNLLDKNVLGEISVTLLTPLNGPEYELFKTNSYCKH